MGHLRRLSVEAALEPIFFAIAYPGRTFASIQEAVNAGNEERQTQEGVSRIFSRCNSI